MKKIKAFFYRNADRGIRNLIPAVIIAQAAVAVLDMLTATSEVSLSAFMVFDPDLFVSGQWWRIVTFALVPDANSSIFFTAIMLFFYWWVGRRLEREWGRLRLNVLYFSTLLVTVAYSLLSLVILSGGIVTGTSAYVNLSLLLALATLIPNEPIYLYFVIKLKFKYLAIISGVLFFLPMLTTLLNGKFGLTTLLPLLTLVPYLCFFGTTLIRAVKRTPAKVRNKARTVDFKSEVKRSAKQKGYVHKCEACGRTDADHPNLEFRYCSLCAGYACYCSDHIFDHVHKTMR